jgi:hypothetical protein
MSPFFLCSFSEDLVDGRAPTRRVVFTEDFLKIAR